jgi:hypothetical protein
MPGSFFETDVLSSSLRRRGEGDRAEAILSSGGAISVQALNELANVVRVHLAKSRDLPYVYPNWIYIG